MTSAKQQPSNTNAPRFLIPLKEANSPNKHVGGKAANLAKVKAMGLRTPDTVVVSHQALTEFLTVNRLRETISRYIRTFDAKTNRALMSNHKWICTEVHNASMPQLLRHEIALVTSHLLYDAPGGLAVRSSATMEDSRKTSFAGVFESYLGCSTAEEVMGHVKQVWCSLWAPKSIRYMKKLGIDPVVHGIDSMAVMIQKVAAARCAGVIHTADSETGNPWRFVLHATSGLSIDLMSISGAGDRLVLDSESGGVLECDIGVKGVRFEAAAGTVQETQITGDNARRPALSDSDIERISKAAKSLDEAFEMRVDIEWALDDEGLVVVQARPLTGLPEFFPHVLSDEDSHKKWWASSFHGGPLPGVFSGNPRSEAEFIPPFFQDISGQEAWTRYHPKDMVFFADPEKEDKTINGYRFATTVKWRTFSDYVKGHEATEAWFVRNEESYRLKWRGFFLDLDECASVSAPAIRSTTTAIELVPSLLWIRDRWADLLAQVWGSSQSFGSTCKELLAGFCRNHVSPEFNTDSLLSGGADSFTFRNARALQELGTSIHEETVKTAFRSLPVSGVVLWLLETSPDCAFLQAFESYCWAFGTKPPSWQGRTPLWIQKGQAILCSEGWLDKDIQAVSAVKKVLLSQSRDVVAIQEAAQRRRAFEVEKTRDHLMKKDSSLVERFDRMYDWASFWTQALNDRHAIAIAYNWLFELMWHVGSRLVGEGFLADPSELLMLQPRDLQEFARSDDVAVLRDTCQQRRYVYKRNLRLTAPALVGKHPDWWTTDRALVTVPGNEGLEKEEVTTTVFAGKGNARGGATGTVRKTEAAEAPDFFDSLSTDDIIVMTVPMASPFVDWHSLLMTAKGVVSSGTPYHHLMQVARECDVPVIGSVEGDLSKIPERATIHLDSDTGEIHVLGKESNFQE